MARELSELNTLNFKKGTCEFVFFGSVHWEYSKSEFFFGGYCNGEKVNFVVSGNCCQVENHDQGELNELNDLNVKWEPCKCVMLNVPLE